MNYPSEQNMGYTSPSSHVILKESFYALEMLPDAEKDSF